MYGWIGIVLNWHLHFTIVKKKLTEKEGWTTRYFIEGLLQPLFICVSYAKLNVILKYICICTIKWYTVK